MLPRRSRGISFSICATSVWLSVVCTTLYNTSRCTLSYLTCCSAWHKSLCVFPPSRPQASGTSIDWCLLCGSSAISALWMNNLVGFSSSMSRALVYSPPRICHLTRKEPLSHHHQWTLKCVVENTCGWVARSTTQRGEKCWIDISGYAFFQSRITGRFSCLHRILRVQCHKWFQFLRVLELFFSSKFPICLHRELCHGEKYFASLGVEDWHVVTLQPDSQKIVDVKKFGCSTDLEVVIDHVSDLSSIQEAMVLLCLLLFHVYSQQLLESTRNF